MKSRCLVAVVWILTVCTPVIAGQVTVTIDWEFAQGSKQHAAVVKIKNVCGHEIKVQNPAKSKAIAFVVMDDRGNLIEPQGVAKVEAVRREDIVLKPGGAFEHTDAQFAEMAHSKGLVFPFHTGTGLLAYELKEGRSYRVTAIYRPYADGDGVASTEHVFMFR